MRKASALGTRAVRPDVGEACGRGTSPARAIAGAPPANPREAVGGVADVIGSSRWSRGEAPHAGARAIDDFLGAAGFMRAVDPILPVLRALGRRLTGSAFDGEDLVQDTLVHAWRGRFGLQPGTNLKAWLLRIERNAFLSARRRARLQVELDQEHFDTLLVQGPEQEEGIHRADLVDAIDALPRQQREAFLCISGGEPYAIAADRLGVVEGTLKSRVARARATLNRTAEERAHHRRAKPPTSPSVPKVKPVSRYEEWKRSGSKMIG